MYSQETHLKLWNIACAWIKDHADDARVQQIGGVDEAISAASEITADLAPKYDAALGAESTFLFHHFPKCLERMGSRVVDSVDPESLDRIAVTPGEPPLDDDFLRYVDMHKGGMSRLPEVARRMTQGDTQEDIAAAMGVDSRVVRRHVDRIRELCDNYLEVQRHAVPPAESLRNCEDNEVEAFVGETWIRSAAPQAAIGVPCG